jgi:transcriptional regulator with XRE-family HTH domain
MTAKTFGAFIAEHRKRAHLSQKELAAKILKEDGEQISPQYLNDLEHDRRNPPSESLLKQLAIVLGVDLEYLCSVAGEMPADVRERVSRLDEKRVKNAWRAFRRAADSKGKTRS